MPNFDRRLFIAGLTAGALSFEAGEAASADDMTLAEVIARHTEARGGAAAIDRINTCRIEVEIVENGQTLNGRYHASMEPRARIDIVVDSKIVFSEGYDSQGVWLWPGDEAAPRASVAEGAANALLHGAWLNLSGLHRFPALGHQLQLMDPELVDGVRLHVVECRYTTGHTTYFYIDPVSWMVVLRRDIRAYHPDVSQAKAQVETRYLDFLSLEGVVVSDKSEDHDMAEGKLLATATVKARQWNPDLPEGLFERNWPRS